MNDIDKIEKGRIDEDHNLSKEKLIDLALMLKAKGYSVEGIAHILRLEQSEARQMIELEIEAEMTIWFPLGSVYKGRQGVYARHAHEFTENLLVELVQMRAREDGEWAIEQGLVGDNEPIMRKMMEWVSRSDNILQCYYVNLDRGPTVDWICRHLAEASVRIGGTHG